MRNTVKLFGLIAFTAVIAFSLTTASCFGGGNSSSGGVSGSNTTSSGTESSNGGAESSPAPAASRTGGEYIIGDTGPGGGKVFYDKGSVSYGWRYLEAAPVGQGVLAWASPAFVSSDPLYGGAGDWVYIEGTGTAIGTGKENTRLILAIDQNAPAAKACADYRGGDKSDWFLPSIDELCELAEQRNHVGIVSWDYFWSSSNRNFSSGSLSDSGNAWSLNFFYSGSPFPGYSTKNDEHNVHAVRAF